MGSVWRAGSAGCSKTIARPAATQLWPLESKLRCHHVSHLSPADRLRVAWRILAPSRGAASLTATVTSAGGPQTQQPLTPRQRRLAQQRRKWEEAQRQQQQPKQETQHPPQQATAKTTLPHKQAAAPSKGPGLADQLGSSGGKPPKQAATVNHERPRRDAAAAAGAQPRSRATGAPGAAAAAPVVVATRASGDATGSSTGAEDDSFAAARWQPQDHAQRRQQQPQQQQQQRKQRRQQQQEHQLQRQQLLEEGEWPSLFAGGAPLSPSLDLCALSGVQLAALARRWADELAEWLERHNGGGRSGDYLPASSAPPPANGHSASTSSPASRPAPATASRLARDVKLESCEGASRGSAGAAAQGPGDGVWGALPLARQLPEVAASRLALLTAAVDSLVTRGSVGHQELADLIWCVAHYDREHSLRALLPAMAVPFSVVPQFMPELRLEDFMSEVELRRDTIYLDDGSRAVEESRMTGWQSEIGATFKYSGKEMQPQTGGLSPSVLKVRDALTAMTGVVYDSVLINYYADGKCGMRYHVDPLYDRWTPNSAVVSLGDTRTFIFREIDDHNTRWQYRVRNGDVVLMYDDCQDRLQHCVRVEKRAEDAGPRMSLVFKERLRGPTGQYLLP
ncbi:hypothetical protein PLESTB_001587100 [Pleodorina starrii]|uniref:Fe2OG dioxygenase domain-containing protein n=1 Tax=Pleodorina starrii TaxID=330485 RepID=A0A9W6F8D0_9CHLO|nr:hypothetical protein PLESTM_000583600 [Pleodorina starrii]GLC60222.1 hypothetical protein PLESTB_001587100 [Pleodorina starrii]GLC65982.1 hypothetical protein PLESTF_000369100 [Pleodorina starrii]